MKFCDPVEASLVLEDPFLMEPSMHGQAGWTVQLSPIRSDELFAFLAPWHGDGEVVYKQGVVPAVLSAEYQINLSRS